jgi:hypothetical protein
MRAKQLRIKSYAYNPFREKPSILASRHRLAQSTGEQALAWLLAGPLQVVINGLAGLIGQFELDWSSRLFLSHDCSIDCIAIRSHIVYSQGHDVTAAQFAVDGEIEQREVTSSTLYQKSGSD